ncbi:MAG: HAD hydrolase-like protein [Pirellulales bacterium]
MKVCLFDIDGTLIRSGGAGQKAFKAALSAEFGIGQFNGGVAFSGRTDRAIVRDFFMLSGVSDSAEAWQRFETAYLRQLPLTLASSDGTVLPGVKSLLADLDRHAAVELGLLTGNTAAGAKLKLSYYGLDHFFRFGGYGDDVLNRDAVARSALNVARQRINDQLRLDDVFVIGDTPLDVRCARAIGARAVAVCTGFSTAEELRASEPDLLLDDLADAGVLFDELSLTSF